MTNSIPVRFGVSLLALGLVAAVACDSRGVSPVPDEASTASDGVPAPIYPLPPDGVTLQLVADAPEVGELTMDSLDGQTLTTSALRGRVTLVNFWATWCGPCREEIPDLVALQDRYPEQLQVIGVSTDEGDTGKVVSFAAEWDINYPIVMATAEINREFPGVFALPTTFVIDPQGRIVQTHVGLLPPDVIEAEVRHLTGLPTNVRVEAIEQTRHMRLANAAQATEIPGVDLTELTTGQREEALLRLNAEGCTCECGLTLAQCRINDSACGYSLPLAQQVVADIAGG